MELIQDTFVFVQFDNQVDLELVRNLGIPKISDEILSFLALVGENTNKGEEQQPTHV